MALSWIDASLYPDHPAPESLDELSDRVDFVARLCSAWDFGVLPAEETVKVLSLAEWTPAVDACRLLTSPTYHLLREWHRLPPLPYLGARIPEIADDPSLAFV